MGFFDDVGWFLGETVKGAGHVALHIAGAPLELTGAALNAVGAKGAADVVNFVPDVLHDIVDNPIDNTPLVGTIVRSAQSSVKGVECMGMPENTLGDRMAKYHCAKEQEKMFNKALTNATADVIGTATLEVGRVAAVPVRAAAGAAARGVTRVGTRLAAREVEQTAARVLVTEAAEVTARDAVTEAIAAEGREAITHQAVLNLATAPTIEIADNLIARPLVVGAEREGAQIAAHAAVRETENMVARTVAQTTVEEATRTAEAAVTANVAAKEAARAAEQKLAARLAKQEAKQLAAREARDAATREWAQKSLLQKAMARNPWTVADIAIMSGLNTMHENNDLPWQRKPTPDGRHVRPDEHNYGPLSGPQRVEPHTRPNNGKSDRQDPTLNHGIDAELLFRDALLAPGDQLIPDASVITENGKVVDTSLNLIYTVPLLIATVALVSELRA
jgi:hypothetical protein